VAIYERLGSLWEASEFVLLALCHFVQLYRAANVPQIVLQMFPGLKLILLKNIWNGVDSMKSLWMDTYFLIILGEEKTSTSGTKTRVYCINVSFRKHFAKRNMDLQRCLSSN